MLGLDAWNGSPSQVEAFRTASSVTFPMLLNAGSSAPASYENLVVVGPDGTVALPATGNLSSSSVTSVKAKVNELLTQLPLPLDPQLHLDTQIESPAQNNSVLIFTDKRPGDTLQIQLFVPNAAGQNIQAFTLELALQGKTFTDFISSISGSDWTGGDLFPGTSASNLPTLSGLFLNAAPVPMTGYLGQIDLEVIGVLSDEDKLRVTSAFLAVAGGTLQSMDVSDAEVSFAPICPGDFDDNGIVNMADFMLFEGVFGTRSSDAAYNALMDMDSSGGIDVADFMLFVDVFDTTCKQQPPGDGGGGQTGVSIPDANLRAVIEDSLSKASGAPITQAEMATLTHLDARNKMISNLTGLEFATNLETLYLSGNNIKELSSDVFSRLGKLQTLDLSSNRELMVLPPNVFAGLHKLSSLSFSYTQIEALPANVFAGLNNLEHLSCYSNTSLTSLPPGIFNGLANLRQLVLETNGLTSLPSGAFDDLTNLQSLWLRGNRLTSLPMGVFDGLINLEDLRLKSNLLTELPGHVFSDLNNLKELSLGNNQLSELPDNLFVGLSSVKNLSLDGNPGAPFPLTVELKRTDTTNELAPGPADFAVRLAPGTPFDVDILLFVHNGTASAASLTIDAGDATSSASASVTASAGASGATVINLGPVPRVPGGFSGLEVRAGAPLVLFSKSDNRQPVAAGNIPSHVLQVGSHQAILDLGDYFSDEDGDQLSFSVVSNDISVVEHGVDDGSMTLIPINVGDVSVGVTATDSEGFSVSQSMFVTVLPAPDPGSFDIDLVFVTPVSEETRLAAQRQVERWTEVIKGDLPEVSISGDFVDCGTWMRGADHRFFGKVDDLVVFVQIATISGGQGLGGPCGLRDGSFLPYTGGLVLDVESAGTPDGGAQTILHEIGHVIGIGTIWDKLGFLQGSGGDDPHFSGPLAIAAFDAAGGENYRGSKVPISSDLGHWAGDAFGWGYPRELMMVSGGTVLSAITIQSLADLGYVVDVTKADPFRLPDAGETTASKTVILRDDIPRGPMSIVNENGRVLRVVDDGNSSDY